eukprot:978018_1
MDVLSVLQAVMSDATQAERVHMEASEAIRLFCSVMEKEQLETCICMTYMDGLLTALFERLKQIPTKVQEACLEAMVGVANNSGECFLKFYDSLLPILKTILFDNLDPKLE